MGEVMEKCSIHLFTLASLPPLTELNTTKEAGVYTVLLCRVKTEYWLENDRNRIFNTNDNINATLPGI